MGGGVVTVDAEPRSVVAMEMAERMLAEVASVDDVRALINFAEQARLYARQSKLGTSAINHATVIKIRAERKLADVVDEGQQKGAIATQDSGDHGSGARAASTSTLPSLGIDSGRLAEARILRDTFTDDRLIERQVEANERDEILSRQQLLAEARAENTRNGAIQSARVAIFFPVFDAIAALAAIKMPADQWAKAVPSHNAYRVNNNLDAAFTWLAALKESWHEPQNDAE